MRKYQIVRVKHIKPGTLKNGCLFITPMIGYHGQIATIVKVTGKDTMKEQYGLSGQPGIESFIWKESWLEEIDDFLSDKDFEI